MNEPARRMDLSEVAAHLEQVAEAGTKLFERHDEDLREEAKRLRTGLFRVVAMGEIKKGKSSFLNALLGIPGLLPVQTNVATSSVFKVHWGEQVEYAVYFRDGRKKIVTAAEVADYGTETGNPGNRKQVDFIGVSAPAPMLRDGFVFVDTPGVGGLFREHRDITFKYAPHADAIFFLTDSVESPLGADELAFLKDLQAVNRETMFIQTKADAAANLDAPKELMARNLALLQGQLGWRREGLNYFIVSSKLKHLADESKVPEDLTDSGFVPVLRYLTGVLKGKKDRLLAQQALGRSRQRVQAAEGELKQRHEVLAATGAEKQRDLEQRLQENGQTIWQWDQEQRPRLEREFRDKLHDLQGTTKTSLLLALKPGGRLAEEARNFLEQQADPEVLLGQAPQVLADAQACASKLLLATQEEVRRQAQRMLEQLSRDTEQSLTAVTVPQMGGPSSLEALPLVTVSSQSDSSFSKFRSTFYGGSMGGSVGGTVGFLLGSVVPIVGNVIGGLIGAAIGGMWGGAASYGEYRQQTIQAVRRNVLEAINRQLSDCQTVAVKELDDALHEVGSVVNDALRQIAIAKQEQIARRQQELLKVRQNNQVELQSLRQELAQTQVTWRHIGEQQARLEAACREGAPHER